MRHEVSRNTECGMWSECNKALSKVLLSFASIFCLFTIAYSQPPTELFKSASQLYKSNQFDQAAVAYEKIISQGYKSSDVYYNLGNCYYKLNNLSKTIINYERALKLAPQDEDIQHNLKIANARVVDKIVPVPQLGFIIWWNNLVSLKTSKGWGTLALGLIWTSLIFFALYIFIGVRNITLTAGCILLFLSLSSFGFALKQSEKEQNPDTAILTIASTYVKSAPDIGGNDLFMLHEGIKFQVLDRVGEWNKIRLADGKVGWVEKGSFEKI